MNTEISIYISKILSGEASEEDIQMLHQWFQENETNLHSFEQTEAIWNALEILKNSDEFNQKEAFSKFQSRIHSGKTEAYKLPVKLPLFDYLIRIAAVITVAFILPFSAFQYFSSKNKNEGIRKFEMVTPKGSRSLVNLPDGTHIWLNSESRLTYPERFVGKTREVYLEGEGYFVVSKDKDHPFIVKTGDINIRVLGTTFNVKSYPSENIIQTTLIEGKVILENNRNGKGKPEIVELKPNQQATIDKQSNQLSALPDTKQEHELKKPQVLNQEKQIVVEKNVNMESITSWKDNRLYFENELFKTIAIKLERRFGVSIEFTDKEIVNFRFSGRFDQISIEEALAALQFASDFKYSIEKDKIYIGQKFIK